MRRAIVFRSQVLYSFNELAKDVSHALAPATKADKTGALAYYCVSARIRDQIPVNFNPTARKSCEHALLCSCICFGLSHTEYEVHVIQGLVACLRWRECIFATADWMAAEASCVRQALQWALLVRTLLV